MEFTRQFETVHESLRRMIKLERHFQFTTPKNKGGTDYYFLSATLKVQKSRMRLACHSLVMYVI
jgi:hypothetical protein